MVAELVEELEEVKMKSDRNKGGYGRWKIISGYDASLVSPLVKLSKLWSSVMSSEAQSSFSGKKLDSVLRPNP